MPTEKPLRGFEIHQPSQCRYCCLCYQNSIDTYTTFPPTAAARRRSYAPSSPLYKPRQGCINSIVFLLLLFSTTTTTTMSSAWVLPTSIISRSSNPKPSSSAAPTAISSTTTTTTLMATTTPHSKMGILQRHWQVLSSPRRTLSARQQQSLTALNAFKNPYQNVSIPSSSTSSSSSWPSIAAVIDKDGSSVASSNADDQLVSLLQQEQGTVSHYVDEDVASVEDSSSVAGGAAAAASFQLSKRKRSDSAEISLVPLNDKKSDNQNTTGAAASSAATHHDDDDAKETGAAGNPGATAMTSTLANAPSSSLDDQAILFARLLLVGAACLYGTTFSLVKIMGDSDLPVGISSTIRFGVAAMATSPWLLAPSPSSSLESSKDAVKDDQWAAIKLGFEVGLWNSIGYVSQAVGLKTTSASTSAFLCSLAVVVVPFLDVWAGKRLKARQWIGAIMALLGVACLELSHGFDGTLAANDLASMIQPFAFGFGFWRLESAMHKYPTQSKRSTAAQIMAVFLCCVVYTAVMETVDFHVVLNEYLSDPETMCLYIFTGVFATALSVYMESIALKTLTASETTLLLSTEPLWGALWAALLVGEHLGTDTVSGGMMILTGCLYSNLGYQRLKALMSGRFARKGSMPVEEELNNHH